MNTRIFIKSLSFKKRFILRANIYIPFILLSLILMATLILCIIEYIPFRYNIFPLVLMQILSVIIIFSPSYLNIKLFLYGVEINNDIITLHFLDINKKKTLDLNIKENKYYISDNKKKKCLCFIQKEKFQNIYTFSQGFLGEWKNKNIRNKVLEINNYIKR